MSNVQKDSIEAPVEAEFIVESIVDSRIVAGKKQYLLKWKGYSDEHNTWEPKENLKCPKLIKAFEMEAERKERERNEKRKASSTPTPDAKVQKRKADGIHGFARGLKPEKIIGATDSPGKLMFLMKWAGTDEADLVPAAQANKECPQIVIKFYEERLMWATPGNENENKAA